tara:strand:+ start:2595 stop:5468 length:2874 start_codon:yes stop_codon:yes gene_type:complete
MRLYFYSLVFFVGLLFGVQNNISEKTVNAGEGNDISSGRSFRTGDYGLVCQNESGSYNTDMENYIYSPSIDIPAGDEVSIDFLVRGSLLDGDVFPEVDYWGMQITRDQGQTWLYVSNPYGDTTGTFPNYVYSDAPEFWSLFSTTYSSPIDIDDYAGASIQMRYWFHSDSDAPQGEGLFLDDIAVNVDGQDIYFESFEDSTMAGWVSVDQTTTTPAWHTDTYGAYGGSGSSWWMGDPSVGTNGGYLDHWYQVLDTPPIQIPAGTSTYSVSFDQKRAIENLCVGASCPECEAGTLYDGWDAFNVRISGDGGVTWEVLQDAFPIYNTRDTYSFGYEFGEGCGVPGWGGTETANPTWDYTEVDIPSSYNGQEVIVRFAFSADPGYCTTDNSDLTGVWVDNIDVAGVFTNDGEDATGFVSQSLVTLGGDLWHVDFIGVPPVIPMPMNVAVLANDGSVEVSWDSPPGGVEYSDQWVSYDDGTFEDAIVFEAGGQGYLGNNFGMPYGVETVTVHAARVWASNAGTTTLAGFAVVGGVPSPTPLYELDINTAAESFTSEIPLDWEFQSSFVIALLVTDVIGLGIDESTTPSTSSWSNSGGWSSWSDVAAGIDGLSDGEFGIQARITSVGGFAPVFNVYRDPGLDGSSFQLMFNGTGISQNSYSDNIVTNGIEYCYRIASVYDEAVSEQTVPVCGLPISSTVYDVVYDDGTSEDVMPVGNGNFVASKFTPDGYPSDLYSASFYLPNSQSGTVLVYVWDDDGEEGKPGTPIVQGFPLNMIQGWNDINFSNEGFTIPISDGGVYVGYQQLAVNFSLGVDWNNSSYASNSMLDFGIGLGWEPLSNYSPGGVWMIRAQMDGENAVMSNADDLNDLIPDKFTLSQNYPNPFNPMTRIQFGLSEKAEARLEIFNILGESVQVVVNDRMEAGLYNYNISMSGLSSGMYFYRLIAIGENGQQLYNEMKKMILVR